ncbi:group II intron reverse transcriptase/maturase [[Clostridium] fimetarium]|uniref:Group II intron reverse transcriptase/maturase n=1 Tax=[Clostridium] fimetarium TaxID=99656 RepID=A0A1I0RYR1_9FIRM|nr:group II intron reverse transcriptase/maturase [[Clostridium] fimetarium]SEW46708.1 group II intron reverse transcriptase/maturase [[Clostridium] fimetarium]
MNDELKMKWHSIYGQILSAPKLMSAWKQVAENKGCGGIDMETIQTFKAEEDKKILSLLQELKQKEYKPTAVKRVYIPKKNGDKRPLGIPVIKDRIVQQSIVNVLSPKFEDGIFHKCSCGYRPNRGIERVMQIILWYIEHGNNYIYDCDIKGFFDNIPHKNMMKILTKYIADGTVLDLIWAWMKSGYMEEGKFMESNSGTQQGGVISPLLANVYLNELDWELEKEGIKFVRYCDDFLLFAKSDEEIKKAGEVAKRVISNLGLEIAINKTKFVDFQNDDFKFVGFDFKHWRERKDGSGKYFIVEPTEQSFKDFKKKIKDATCRKLTLSQEEWINRVNPIIRGKVNYYLYPHKAVEINNKYGIESHCFLKGFSRQMHGIDMYTRQRLRVCMQHKHPTVRKGFRKSLKWNIEYFCKIKLIPSNWLYYNRMYGYTIEQYIEKQTTRNKGKNERYINKLKSQGIEYYTESRLKAIAYSKGLVTS